MITYFKSYIVIIIFVKNIYLRKDLGFVIIFHPQRIRPCNVSKNNQLGYPCAITDYSQGSHKEVPGLWSQGGLKLCPPRLGWK